MFHRNELSKISTMFIFPMCLVVMACVEPGGMENKHDVSEAIVGEWTEWLNVSDPEGSGEYEARSSHDYRGLIPCNQPTRIECRVRETHEPASSTGQTFEPGAGCTLERGLACRNIGLFAKRCFDYEVRYLCPADTDHDSFPDPEDNLDPAPTKIAVGTLDGELTIDGNGQSNYKLSLRVPPGSGGVAPSLALGYQSGGSDGVLGRGWSLLGPSVISVASSTKHYNQKISPITLSSDDQYDLDGQRLVKISSSDESTHYIDVYRTVVESRVRVRAYRPKTKGAQPTHFIVSTGEQIKRVYGQKKNAKLTSDKGILAWYMHRTEDASGNFIDYNYQDSLLVSIDYTGNAGVGLSPYNHVDFLYETRPDVHVLYAGGMIARKQSVRIRKVQMRTGLDNYVREYRLSYGRSKLTGISQLTSIQEVTGLNSGETLTALPATTFVWKEGDKTPLTFETVSTIDGPTEEGFQVLAQGDFDRDGRVDFILGPVDQYGRIKNSATKLHTYLSSANYVARTDLFALPTETYSGYERQIVTSGDFDGDGSTDFMLTYMSSKGVWRGKSNPLIYFSNADGQFEKKAVSWNPQQHPCVREDPKLRGTGDFNGDGAIDLLLQKCIVTSVPGPRSDAVKMTVVNHDIGLGTNLDKPWKVYVAELNGDGKADVVVERTGDLCNARWVTLETYTNIAQDYRGFLFKKVETVSPPHGTRPVGIADFNGDGLSDLLLGYSSASDTWCQDKTKFSEFHLRPSKGDGTLADWLPTTKTITAPVRVRAVGDHDGDGKGDFHAGDKLYAYNGEIFEERPAIPLASNREIKIVGDINRNGVPDFVVATTDDKGRIAANTKLQPYLSKIGPPEEITSIKNGHGSSTEISYARLTDPDVYQKGEGAQYPQRNFYAPLTVVSEVRNDTGSATKAVLRYEYTNGVIDVSQQRFLGFESMRTIDDWRGLSILETFVQGFPCRGMLKSKETSIDGIVVRLEEHAPSYQTHKGGVAGQPTDCTNISPAVGTTYNAFARTQTETRWELDGTFWDTKTQETGVDRFGNVTFQKTTFGDNSTETVDTVYEYVVDARNWIPGRISTQKTVSTKSGNNHERKIRYQYVTTGWGKRRVEYETRDEDTDREIEAKYSYDGYGNITQKVQGERLEGKYFFDSKGRFPICTKNALSHLEYREYSEIFGVETRIVDANTLDKRGIKNCPATPLAMDFPSTEIEYDGFGRKTKELLPALDASERVVKSYLIEGNSGRGYKTTVTASGAPMQIRYFDRLEREISAASQRQVNPGTGQKPWGVSVTQYDRMGRVTRKSNVFASNSVEGEVGDTKLWDTLEYDALDRVTRSTDFGNIVTTDFYTGHTQVTTVDADGKAVKTTRRSDPRGNVVEVEDDAGGKLILDYDAGGRLTKSTTMGSGKSVVTRMEYDVVGNRTALIDPNLGSRAYEYDLHQQLTLQRDARNQETTMKYDVLGRMTQRTSPEGVEEWTFDRFQGTTALGKMMKEVGVASLDLGSRPSRTYSYDLLGRLTKADSSIRGKTASVLHEYNTFGHVTERRYEAGGDSLYDVEYTYDDRGFLVSAKGSDGKDWFSETKYTAAGDVRSYLNGAGSLTTKGYDEAKGIVDLIEVENNDQRIARIDLEYSSVGNMTKKTTAWSKHSKGKVEEYQYDRLNRLTNYPEGFSKYDALGNITERSVGGQSYTPVYDTEHPNAVSEVGSVSYRYDANGNMTKRGDSGISWSSFDKPSLMLRGNDYTSFEYDAGRNRVFQSSREASTTGLDMYADAEDGSVTRWRRVDNDEPCHVAIVGGVENREYSVTADRISGCRLANTVESDWEFGPSSVLQFDLQKPSSGVFSPKVVVTVETTKGTRFLEYGWGAENLGPGEKLTFKLDGYAINRQTVVRDLAADLKRAQPDAEFITITDFVVLGNALIDNIGSPHEDNQWTRRLKERYYWFQDLEKTDVHGERCTAIPGITVQCSAEWTHGAYVLRIAGPEASTLGTIAITQPHVGQRTYHHNDHLGSLVVRTNDVGRTLQRYTYDPWGAPVQGYASMSQWPDYGLNDRGFTGHEMLDRSKLIHMNGRIYDPIIGRFLSPDPIVKGGFNLQAHNRYSYVLNNPLVNVDPSGQIWKRIRKFFKRTARAIGRFFKRYGAIILGAIAGFVTGGWALAIAPLSWGAVSTAVFVGAVSGFASGFTGALASGQGLKAALKAGLTGSVVSGVLAGIQAALVKWIYEKFTPLDKMQAEIYRVRGRQLDKTPLSFSEIRGKSGKIFVNGQSNELQKAFELALERVPSDDFYLIHNPTVSSNMDTIESVLGKLTGSTPISESTARILNQFDLTNSHIYAHSQGGIITRNALVMNHRLGQDLAGLKVTFDGAAVNWASTSALFKTMGVSLPYRAFTAHPWDMIPNLTGYNALFPAFNPYRLVGSVLAAPLVFIGGEVSPHTHFGGGAAVRGAPQVLFKP